MEYSIKDLFHFDNYEVTESNYSNNITDYFLQRSSHSPNKEIVIKAITKSYDVGIFLLISFFSFLINLRVFCFVMSVTKRKIRPVSILVAHLSTVAIFFTLITILHIADKLQVITTSGSKTCELLSFSRNVLHSVFPLNIIGITYERIRTFRITFGKLLVCRTISLIWLIAILGSIPSLFVVEYQEDFLTGKGKCQQIPGIFEVVLAYELTRFFIYHVLVVSYMTYALFKIQSKIRYLYILKPIPNERMKRKVQRIRCVYLHSVIFILIWLPVGFLQLAYKVLNRKNFTGHFSSLVKIMAFLNYIYFILNPLIYLCLNEDMSKLNVFKFTCFTDGSEFDSSYEGGAGMTTASSENPKNTLDNKNNNKRQQKTRDQSRSKSASLKNIEVRYDAQEILKESVRSKRSRRRRRSLQVEYKEIRKISEMSRVSTLAMTDIPSEEFLVDIHSEPRDNKNDGYDNKCSEELLKNYDETLV